MESNTITLPSHSEYGQVIYLSPREIFSVLKNKESALNFQEMNISTEDLDNDQTGTFILKDGESLIAMAVVSPHPTDSRKISFKAIATTKAYRNKGCAKALVEAVFVLAQKMNRNIERAHYFSPDGQRFLKPVIKSVAEKFPNVRISKPYN